MDEISVRYRLPVVRYSIACIVALFVSISIGLALDVSIWVSMSPGIVIVVQSVIHLLKQKIDVCEDCINNSGQKIGFQDIESIEIKESGITIYLKSSGKWINWKAKSFSNDNWQNLSKAILDFQTVHKITGYENI